MFHKSRVALKQFFQLVAKGIEIFDRI